MSTLDVDQKFVPDQLVDQLAKGYDALNIEIRLLDEQRCQLENRLSWAKQQVCNTHLFERWLLRSTSLHDDFL